MLHMVFVAVVWPWKATSTKYRKSLGLRGEYIDCAGIKSHYNIQQNLMTTLNSALRLQSQYPPLSAWAAPL